ncbi:uncharacterized protein LOC131648952 [Vicia villosa]|uniref:uncharacterized protein LOC131648952 n=1 Tax=Vicia villosa TaxID=3911 RepID=UPI00273C767E|nr:uncharacterized protein LOC131648952 [Vicia villosa]
MARPIDYVKEINESKDLWKIAVSCKHIWSVTSSSNKYNIEMVLVDSKVHDMIQAIVPTYLVSKFKSELAAGTSYIMQNFKKTDLPDIPAYYLNLLGLDAIVEGRFQSNVLVDILGGITEISQSQINGDNNKNIIVFTIVDTSLFACIDKLNNMNIQEDSNIVIVLVNARVKEAQGGYPVSVSNTWNGTKLLINDLRFDEVKKQKESLGNDLSLLSTSSLQSVALKDGKLQCYAKHVISEPVPRYKLEVLVVDGNSKAKFIFWDTDYVKLIGKSALQMKMDLIEAGYYDPLEFPYELDSILKKKYTIRAVFQPKNSRLSVIGFKTDEDYRKKSKDSFKGEEHTSKLETPDPLSQDDIISCSEPVSASADYDPSIGNFGLTPSKRSSTDVVEDVESVQQSSTKLKPMTDVKKEK